MHMLLIKSYSIKFYFDQIENWDTISLPNDQYIGIPKWSY